MRTAYRRHHDQRVLNRRLRLYRNQWAKDDPRWRGILTDTGTICSCIFCRWPSRRYSGRSRQERMMEAVGA